MKKTLAILLALVMCLGILAGCQQEPAETTTAPTTTAATSGNAETTTAPTEEPAYSFEGKTLDVITGLDLNGHDIQKWVKEDLGLDLVYQGIPENLEALFTEKVTPSLVWAYGPSGGHTYGRYGVYVNLYDYKDIMPNFFAKYEQYGDQLKADYETGEGELYSAPVFLNGDVQHYGWLYREDIFEELNLEVPTDWDSFLAVCKALKEAYPDSYPFTARNLTGNLTFFYEFAQQFGVRYRNHQLTMDQATGTYYNPYTTQEAKTMLEMFRSLIDLGYMDIATLSNDTAGWVADMTTGKSFITHDKAFQLTNLENAGQEANPDYSLRWFHNIPLVESDMPYVCHASKDYANYSWSITTNCPDVELAVRFLDWLYSEEGKELYSWGKEGTSYQVNEDGSRSFIEGYDKTFYARYQLSGDIDMTATASTYSPKCQEMIFDTMEVSKDGLYVDPALVYTNEETKVFETYQTDWYNVKNAYYQKFLLGELEINDANWEKMANEMAAFGEAEMIAASNAAYQRLIAG